MRGSKFSHGSMALLTGVFAALFLYLGLFRDGFNLLYTVVGGIWLAGCICHILASQEQTRRPSGRTEDKKLSMEVKRK